MKLKKHDEVVLDDRFENRQVYVVVEVKDTGIVSLFPKDGGFLVAACVDNLKKVE